MKEDRMLAEWVEEQMKEASKHRQEEDKILGKVYEKVKQKSKEVMGE